MKWVLIWFFLSPTLDYRVEVSAVRFETKAKCEDQARAVLPEGVRFACIRPQ